jgi:hypothetical protein
MTRKPASTAALDRQQVTATECADMEKEGKGIIDSGNLSVITKRWLAALRCARGR